MAILVIGLGLMGQGIAATLVTEAKVPVVIVDSSPTALEVADRLILKLLKRTGVDAISTEGYVTKSSSLAEAFRQEKIDFVIEAVPENLNLKQKIFKELEALVGKNTVLATNTSSLPITEIAQCVKHPEQVIGMHFFNPVHIMKGLEIIPTKYTAHSVLQRTILLGEQMNKTVSICKMDIPGFLVNRILNASFLEALSLLERGAASAEDIDKIMVSCTNAPMGPFRLTDMVGLDTAAAIARIIYEKSGNDSKYRPSKLLDEMVSQGKLGVKSGQGFYSYKSRL